MISARRRNTLARPALLLLILAALALPSCSSIQLAYGHLDWWLRSKINNYLDVEGPQKQQLSIAVDNFHRWHRQTQLPLYADFFDQLAIQVASGKYQRAQLEQAESQVDEFWQRSTSMLCDQLLPLVLTFDEAQINQLAKNIEQEREKSLKKWSKNQRKQEKNFRKHAERWLGNITDSQQQLIDRRISASTFDPKLRDQQRQLWQKHFIGTLRSKPAGYEQTLRQLLLDPQQLWPDDYRKMQQQLRSQAMDLALEILRTSNAEQRQHLQQTLRDYATDFRILAAKK